MTPQGLLGVCRFVDVPLAELLAAGPRLVVVLANVRDPGNAGTVLRTADAAGADGVVFAAASVDPYNSKCVRSSAGSLFHLPVVVGVPLAEAIARAARGRPARARRRRQRAASSLDSTATGRTWPARPPGCSATRPGACRTSLLGAGRRGGRGADLRPGREPEPGRRRGGLPVRLGPRAPRRRRRTLTAKFLLRRARSGTGGHLRHLGVPGSNANPLESDHVAS